MALLPALAGEPKTSKGNSCRVEWSGAPRAGGKATGRSTCRERCMLRPGRPWGLRPAPARKAPGPRCRPLAGAQPGNPALGSLRSPGRSQRALWVTPCRRKAHSRVRWRGPLGCPLPRTANAVTAPSTQRVVLIGGECTRLLPCAKYQSLAQGPVVVTSERPCFGHASGLCGASSDG